MSESGTHTALPKAGLKAGKLFRREEQGQGYAHRNNPSQPFFSGTVSLTADMESAHPEVQSQFIPGIHRYGGKEELQAKCAECEHEEKLQRAETSVATPAIHRSAAAEEVQAKCAECEQEEKLQRVEMTAIHRSAGEEVQTKCAECEKEEQLHKKETEGGTPQGLVQAKEVSEEDLLLSRQEDAEVHAKPSENISPALQRNESSGDDAATVQTSLKVGRPDDAYEIEADRMADKVMRMPLRSFTGGGGTRPEGNGNNNNNNIQRNEEEGGEVQTKPISGLQRAGDGGLRTSDNFTSRLKTSGQGKPLAAPVREDMESAFQADFSAVRIHTGTEAAGLSRDIGAKAFAHQHNIYFAENNYQPESPEGRFLLAHELTHTVQQGAAKTVQRDPEEGEEEESSWWDMLRNGAEYVLESVLPASIYQFYKDIKSEGLLGFVKGKLFGLFRGLFNGLGFSDQEFMLIIQIFLQLKAQLPAIIDGLSKGDCAPLFAALNVLSAVISGIAGAVWDRVMNAIEPLRQWLNNIWDTYMAPALDRITAFAGEVWERIKSLGRWIWDAFYWVVIKPYRDAWDWICEKLGFTDSDEGGFMSYVTGLLGEAWQYIKAQLRPVIEPIQEVVSAIGAMVNMEAIRKLQEDATEWLNHVADTATAMGGEDDAVANKQLTLREVLLPALNNSIDRIKVRLQEAGRWVVDKVNNIATTVSGFVTGIGSNQYLSPVYSLISWVPATMTSIQDWAVDKVNWLFDKINTGMDYIRDFMKRVLDMLMQLVSAASDLLGRLGDFILGPLNLVPKCIKDPIVNWITEVILKKIPVIAEFIELADKWPQIKAAALTVLKQVFVDGALAKGLWTFFRNLLSILGIDPTLVTTVIAKAASNFSAIIKKPLEFLKNVWNVIKGGFVLFFDNIGTHLLTGAMDWLFGEVKGAVSVAPPKDFTLGSILGYVMDLFGITKENIYKRMELNPRIGPEKVAKIRKLENILTGALEWITVWIKEGPAGLLRKAKEKLNDLKETVINGIIGWVTTKVSAEIMQRLATSSDPLGIGATINTIILIYDTMKTAVAYVNRMLNIANQAMDNLKQIIEGDVKNAQEAFEQVLGKAVPVVIGFAVEVIIGPVGEKIQEIVTAGRTKVDEAIDWLINMALNAIDAIINAAKSAAGAILGWLGLTKKFPAEDGETHTLSFKGTESNAQLMIASTPMTFNKWIDGVTIDDPGSTEGKKRQKNKVDAKAKYGEIETTRKKKETAAYTKEDKEQDVKVLLDELSALLGPLFKGQLEDCSTEANNGLKFGGLHAAAYAKSMFAKALTKKKMPDGSQPNVTEPDTFRIINQRRNGSGSFYVLGHLLNHNLGGTGLDMKNLTPLTRSANGTHHSLVEHNIKTSVTKGNAVEYSVTPKYERKKTTTTEEKQVLSSRVADKAKIIEIIREETKVPKYLECKAYLVNPKDKTRTKFFDNNIDNDVNQRPDSYDLVGIKKADVFLDCNKQAKLETIEKPMTPALAAAIIVAMKHRKRDSGGKRFDSYDSLTNYQIDGKYAFNSRQRAALDVIATLPYVKLYQG
ncbi:eCIS core domain-containing protein [Chitinophaga sp. 22321]|uniref:DUF4157 domain-containing protein n=1 Tax=Chitinophaga hostae TaxID=2831022 RepID=A0ABS5J4I5_9BACT|nr:DUF4157 domain-containing protein [Chitinophaga hostae]MBS0029995.1 DUF4157 domain-containing protein [Chitinophaga hostae]